MLDMKFEFKNTFLFFSTLLILTGCASKKNATNATINNATHSAITTPKIGNFKTGAENYTTYLPLLANKIGRAHV